MVEYGDGDVDDGGGEKDGDDNGDARDDSDGRYDKALIECLKY